MSERCARSLAVGAAVAAAIVVAISLARVVTDPFGDSHDGRNGAVWGQASAAFRADPVGSRLGARAGDFQYANHPPLIVVETAITESIAGAHRWVTRAPAWLGSLAAIALCAIAARRIGVGAEATVIAVALAATSPLFVSYMAMLDTPVTSLPFGVATLVSWLGTTPSSGRRRLLSVAAWGALCALAGWQALAFAALLGISSLRTARQVAGTWLLTGATCGVLLVLAHQLWVQGSLSQLVDQFGNRTTLGADNDYSVTWTAGVRRQVEWFVDLVNPAVLVLGVIGLVLLVRDGGDRRLVAVTTTATVVLYDVALAGGAAFHDYWSYWSVLPLALGAARSVQWALASPHLRRSLVGPALVVPLVAATGVALADDEARAAQDRGVSAALLVRRASTPSVRALGLATPTWWIPYERGDGVDSDEVDCLGDDCLVLVDLRTATVLGWNLEGVRAVERRDRYVLAPPTDMLAAIRSSRFEGPTSAIGR